MSAFWGMDTEAARAHAARIGSAGDRKSVV